MLLWVAALLAMLSGSTQLSIAILVVIVLNAVLAFAQEQQAEHAVEALGHYLPQQVWVIRNGHRQHVPARDPVRGDVLVIDEGNWISADARIAHRKHRGGHVRVDR
ncbi:MAG TPA: hypothetical protein VN748_13215 [Pseudonocardiaceae bacterium]|nr:hypothetical protein [Pseudonocardiaceae bacterium]